MNILFVSIEDLNDWIEPLGGHPQVRTPNLSRLASRAAVFTHAYAVVPACSPSRTATLFGRAPWETGVYTNDQHWTQGIEPGQGLSLVGALRGAGYRTTGAGKIFHKDIAGIDPADWDDYHREARHRQHPVLSKVVAAGDLHKGTDFGPADEALGDFDADNTDWMIEQIRPGQDRQFWGFGLYRPHLPFIVPQRFFDLYPDPIELPPGLGQPEFNPWNKALLRDLPEESAKFANRRPGRALRKHGEYRDFIRAYLASISYADWQLGRVLDRLDETGQTENTLVVLWSDHGWQLGEKLAFRKFTLWERALRVPLMIAGPGIEAARHEVPVSLLDVYPTLMTLAGARAPGPLSGQDLTPILRGETMAQRGEALSVWGHWDEAGQERMAFSIRTEAHRYTVYWAGGEELYDHAADPWEHQNLLADGGGGNLRALADELQERINRAVPDIAVAAG